ncbi:hypothetical protein G7Y89_g12857 [Cudoniella acicularis]|uniref:NmrA-like domain-containing protein n=1 Tax=Cudoniella acicularis TaxID=354080 RepID=A0A8H4R7Z7_9HELO|nr:hypothetical protein G7Y89_g12857 [Cudoniella acicularis]
MAKTIAVLGVTGNQGGSVATHFLSLGWNVRGITRNASSSKALALAQQGISIVTADLDTPSTLIPAFSGAHVIFAITDFWATFLSSYPELKKISNRATGEYALSEEVRRGKAIADATAHVLKEEGVLERFVYSTLPNFTEQSKGKYTYCYHFDGKAEVSEYLKGKKELWERSSLLNMAFYTSNLSAMGAILGVTFDKENGKLIWNKPGANAVLHPWVVPEDTGIFAELLVRSPPKQDLLAVNEMASYNAFMDIWSEVTGVPSEVRAISVQEADEASPGGLAREAAESNSTSAEFGWGKHLVMPKDLDPQVRLTTCSKSQLGEKPQEKPYTATNPSLNTLFSKTAQPTFLPSQLRENDS